MPILRLNASPEGLVLHNSPASALRAVRQAARGRGPVIVMIHGFKYDPSNDSCNPHAILFANGPDPDASGHAQWPRPLGFGTGQEDEGLAIAFGWRARGSLWRAEQAARAAGRHLAAVIRAIKSRASTRPIHVISHSMGSELVFEALWNLPGGAIDRIVALQGASYACRAAAALQTPAGRTAELFNITSRENDLFDFLFERLIAPPKHGDKAMGAGLDLPNVANIQIDCAATRAVLARFGGHICAPQRRICHWSGYTRGGALQFYARLLRQPQILPLADLQAALPDRHAPRWSRLLTPRHGCFPLPRARKAAS